MTGPIHPLKIIAIALTAHALSLSLAVAELKTKTTTFTYKQVGELEIKADVLRADDDLLRPVVVWIHGGALINGHRAGVSGRVKTRMLQAGYAIVSIDYPPTLLIHGTNDTDVPYEQSTMMAAEFKSTALNTS